MEDSNKIVIRRNLRRAQPKQPEKVERQDIDLYSGGSVDLDLSGDISVVDEDMGRQYMGLHFHDMLRENYRKFQVQPKPNLVEEKRPAKAIIRIFQNRESEGTRSCIRTFDLELDYQSVVDYYYVEPEPEPVIEVVPEPEIIEAPPSPPPSPKKQEVRPPPQTASWLRLITPTKPPKKSKFCYCYLF